MVSLSLLLPLLAAGSPAQSGAFDPSAIPEGARWVVHVDLAALARSEILRALHADGVRFENEFGLHRIERAFGLDPFADLRSLTFYGAGATGAECVWVAVGTRALESVRATYAAGGARTLRVAGAEAFCTTDSRWIAFLPEGADSLRVLAAHSESTLREALLVARGQAASLGPAPPTGRATRGIAARPAPGSLVFAASAPAARYEDNASYLRRALELLL